MVVPDRDRAIGICTVGGRDAGAVRFEDEGVAFVLVPLTQVLITRLEYKNCAHSFSFGRVLTAVRSKSCSTVTSVGHWPMSEIWQLTCRAQRLNKIRDFEITVKSILLL